MRRWHFFHFISAHLLWRKTIITQEISDSIQRDCFRMNEAEVKQSASRNFGVIRNAKGPSIIEDKAWQKKLRNRKSALAARERKKAYMLKLEQKVCDLQFRKEKLTQENVKLKEICSSMLKSAPYHNMNRIVTRCTSNGNERDILSEQPHIKRRNWQDSRRDFMSNDYRCPSLNCSKAGRALLGTASSHHRTKRSFYMEMLSDKERLDRSLSQPKMESISESRWPPREVSLPVCTKPSEGFVSLCREKPFDTGFDKELCGKDNSRHTTSAERYWNNHEVCEFYGSKSYDAILRWLMEA